MNIFKPGIAVAALGMTLASGIFLGQAIADQPHMRSALDFLKSARDQLQIAERDKHGHRAEALRLTNQAIDEVRAGIDSAE